jgi:hypothetical protein
VIFFLGSCGLFAQVSFEPRFLLISASWVARIIGVSHWHPAWSIFFILWNTSHKFSSGISDGCKVQRRGTCPVISVRAVVQALALCTTFWPGSRDQGTQASRKGRGDAANSLWLLNSHCFDGVPIGWLPGYRGRHVCREVRQAAHTGRMWILSEPLQFGLQGRGEPSMFTASLLWPSLLLRNHKGGLLTGKGKCWTETRQLKEANLA